MNSPTDVRSPDRPTEETVAVVVVTYNSRHLLADLVDSLDKGLCGVAWHVTIADNASSDGSLDEAGRLMPQATLVQTGHNGGYAAGINAAVTAAAPHTAVLVLNPDVRLGPDCIRPLLEALRMPGTGMAVPRLVDGDGALIETMRREPSVLRAWADALLGARRAGRYPMLGEVVTDVSAYQTATVTDWAEGSTLLISSDCWQRCGPWDESFFLYSEETDFALRCRDAGLVTRFVPSSSAIHLEGDSRRSAPLWTLLTLNRLRLFRRRNGITRATAFWGALVLREASRALMGKETSRMALRGLVSYRQVRAVRGPHSLQK